MPEIRIQSRPLTDQRTLQPDELAGLVSLVVDQCIERFPLDERRLTPGEFSVITEHVSVYSPQEQDVIIRISLQSTWPRLRNADQDVAGIARIVEAFLDCFPRRDLLRLYRRVGVSLAFTEIRWAEA